MASAYTCILLLASIHSAFAQWGYSQDEIDVFDLADEFKTNFYEFLGLTQDASSSDVRRSYRRLSLTMHPDKNKTEGAEENFRLLAAVYEVLKNKEKREIYDKVLVDGIPSAYLYVPKQLRKMSLMEVSTIIAVIFTLGHYLLMWGSYAEKRLVFEEGLGRSRKKKSKAKKKSVELQNTEDVDNIQYEPPQKPKVIDILPIAITRGIYKFAKFLPVYIREKREEVIRKKEEEKRRQQEKEEELQQFKLDQERREEKKAQRRERNREKREEMLKYVETSLANVSHFQSEDSEKDLEALYNEWSDDESKKENKGKKQVSWTAEDESDLVKLMSKYPVGSSKRWQLIADELNKRVPDVITRAKQIKSSIGSTKKNMNQSLKPSKKELSKEIPDDLPTIRPDDYVATSDTPEGGEENTLDSGEQWTQQQQKLLELALQQFPKGTPERWDKIAKCVPLKQKEECISRYRYLAEKIQQKRKQKS